MKKIYVILLQWVLLNLNHFLKIKNRIGTNPRMFEINKVESFDIDDMEDFKIAESLQKS